MVPFACLEKLALVRCRELDFVDCELELLLREVGVTETEETVLLDTHNRRYVLLVVSEIVHTHYRLVGQLLHIINHSRGRASRSAGLLVRTVETTDLEIVVLQAHGRGDGA